jgi:hypothetical protein
MPQVYIKLSSNQESPVGIALYRFFYGNPALRDMAPGKCGYPHNGGEHSLSIKGDSDECAAFIELFVETYPQTQPYMQYVLDEIAKGSPRIDICMCPEIAADAA